MRSSRPKQLGFTLVEVLVALVILAIGLLGLAGLQVSGMRNNQSAYLRSQATLLAYDMSDRMRGNPIGMRNGAYNSPAATAVSDCVQSGANAPNGCTTAQLATNDADEWTNALSTSLPGGKGIVCIDSTPEDRDATTGEPTAVPPPGDPLCDNSGTVYAIKVWWNDGYEPDGDAVLRVFITTLQP